MMLARDTRFSDVLSDQSGQNNNENLSSILSQIRDDGPARRESARTESARENIASNNDKFVDLNAKKFNAEIERKVNSYVENRISPEIDKAKAMKHGNGADRPGPKFKYRYSICLLCLLALIMIASITFYIIRMETRADQMQATISEYDVTLSEIEKINKSLVTVKDTIARINSGENSDKNKVEKDSAQAEDKNISILRDEIRKLKVELREKTELLAVNNIHPAPADSDTGSIQEVSINKGNDNVSSSVQQDSSIKSTGKDYENWKVNLASLSNKQKVESIAATLRADGLSPMIQMAMVNGRNIYRLSVGGFASYKKAELFVLIADEEYGLKGGWVKRSGK